MIIGLTTLSTAQQSDSVRAGSTSHLFVRDITSTDTVVYLPHEFILIGTDSVTVDSILLLRDRNYNIDFRSGKIILLPKSLGETGIDFNTTHRLMVRYRALPFSFQSRYLHREPLVRIDSLTGEHITLSKPTSKFSIDDFFHSNLQKSGNIMRGFTIGTNRDLSLSSGFRMQMAGNISDDVEVVAALTDENSPIQPEGTTQTLQEIDKVFIELRGKNLSATFGDFNLLFSGNEFGGYQRKLQGAKGGANYQTENIQGSILLSGASARGKYSTNQLQGVDGVQGPYRLFGANNERDILIIAGTERVFVDGVEMTRGEINDYVIDYASSEITFTPRRLISRYSRIVVDYEYTDRRFNRNMLALNNGTNFFNDRFSLNLILLKEADDESSPIDLSLNDTDRSLLQAAGDERRKAVESGVEYIGPGKGQYVKKDTVISISPGSDSVLTIYRYTPEDSVNAVYIVNFSFVGFGKGDYKKVSVSHYQFVGINQGSYAPVRFLPFPESHSLADLEVDARVRDNLTITGEYARSNSDANLFSNVGDDDNVGSAATLLIHYNPQAFQLGGKDFGSLDLKLKERFVNRRFVPMGRINEIEFSRKWNLDDSSRSDEEIREGTLLYQPVKSLSLQGGIGRMNRDQHFVSNRYTATGHFLSERLPQIDYDIELIKNRNALSGISDKWTRQHGFMHHSFGIFHPSLRYEGEVLKSFDATTDTLNEASFRFDEIIPRIVLGKLDELALTSEIGWRWDDSLRFGNFQRIASTLTQHYGMQLQKWSLFSTNVDFIVQQRKFNIPSQTNKDVHTVLVRMQSRSVLFNRGLESDFFYEGATERTAKLERIFQQVPKGQGNYIYLGDINGNHIIDPPDFRLSRFDADFIALTIPSDEFEPTVDLKTSLRVRWNLSRLLTQNNWYGRLISTLSTETYVRIEEKSTEVDKRQIYLLHLSRFMNDQTTLLGSNYFSQDIHFLENNPEVSLRLRFVQRRGLTQYALLTERLYYRERSIRLRLQLIKEISNQIDLIHTSDLLMGTQWSNRVRHIFSQSLIYDLSYRPSESLELGLRLGLGEAINFDTTIANMNDQAIRLVYSLEERGQFKIEIIREELNINKEGHFYPYELTSGRMIGKTWLVRTGLGYRITQFLQSNFTYEGRNETALKTLHTARMEVRAFF